MKTFKIWLKVYWLSGLCKNMSFEVEARSFGEAFAEAENRLAKSKIKKIRRLQADIVGYIFEPPKKGANEFEKNGVC
ncbi:TPA: hypothetical protein O2E65_001518 [Listeria monocytogenes]|uniref:hypothetical protein n=1 Tax=Listeria monocytogenes TaxID=1639 RepID=UPI000F16AA9A|nr:hypothetical protein [Listeria monocytogenes]EAD9138921.1 hypothetical protein [Listeria monocytogenes]EAF1189788.1 hypothetical protein [Listeria monocytogenes]EJC6460129.1 hypothetical protein [Listeria monocytogenes]MBC6362270.1 hypothetical protein [Listeria monocytogenes]MCR58666.1 hypothetical protein [Listeria monocytogenes]